MADDSLQSISSRGACDPTDVISGSQFIRLPGARSLLKDLSNHQRNMASENTTITVGVLALQGAFKEHLELLQQASKGLASQKEKNARSEHVDWKFIEVRTEADLWTCDALIIPGGESTTMSLVASRNGLLEPLREYVK